MESGFSTADGYAVRFTKASLLVGEFTLATSAGQTGPTTNGALEVDLLAPAPRLVRVFENVPAQRWDAVRWSLAPATDGGVSFALEGTLSKDNTNKTFTWGFSTNTLYSNCTAGVTIPSNGKATGELDVDVTRLWSDSLSDAGTLRADALFNADTGDAVITLDELRATPTPAGYEQSLATGDLADFMEFQLRGVGSFQGAPCTGTAR